MTTVTDATGTRRRDDEPRKVVLVRVTRRDQPGATAYWLTALAVAERWVADAEGSGDQVEILSRGSLAAAAGVSDALVLGHRSGLCYLGRQVGGVWVPSRSAAQAQTGHGDGPLKGVRR